MRILKKLLVVVSVLITILIVIGLLFYSQLKPTYKGNIELSGIQNETTIHFDDYGVPHIYADTQEDAFIALGYAHAQDRLWQMELVKRIAPGRLSEIFGKEFIKTDKFFITLNIEESSKIAIDNLDTTSRHYKLAMAYLNGVNQFIKNGPTPIEFYTLGIEKEKFKLLDIYNVFGYMGFNFAMAHKTDPVLSALNEKLGIDYINELEIDVNPATTLIKNSKNQVDEFIQLNASINVLLDKMPVPPFIGSNSWVLSTNKTANGKVIFANDPHIGFSQPSVWYEAHIVTPTYEMYGYHLAGSPFPLLGHNRKYAYGLTMFENDDIDFYKETNHPTELNKYKTPNGWETYKISSKTINVKDEGTISFEVKSSRHGPLMNGIADEISSNSPIAMSWIYTQEPNSILEALYAISNAKNILEFEKGVSLIHAPGLNVMYGDVDDNVAWWAAGKLYKQQDHVNRKFILDGASGNDDITEFIDFKENPHAINPEWNYVYSANNQPDTISNILYPGYYLPEDRAKRIVQLIEPKNNWTQQEVGKMIIDVTSSVAPSIVKDFNSVIDLSDFSEDEQKAITILQNWDGSFTTNQVAPTIYNKWIYLYLKNTFKDEMGEQIFTQLLNTHFMKRVIASQIQKNNSIWWDDITTNNKIESKKEILTSSLKQAVVSLQNQLGNSIDKWTWDSVHTLEHQHAFGKNKILRKLFNVGPFQTDGSQEVINNSLFDYNETGEYNVIGGPSTRRIIDFSDVENSISILPTGQSGNVFSKHYKDQADMFAKGAFRKMKLNKEEIEKSTNNKLVIKPKN